MSYTAAMAESLIISRDSFWLADQFTFSIPTAGSTWQGYAAGREPFNALYAPLNPAQAAVFRAALVAWDSVIAPDFVETNDLTAPGNFRAALTNTNDYVPNTSGYTSYPPFRGGQSVVSGDVWLNSTNFTLALNTASQQRGFYALIQHELGHALGLRHTSESVGFDPEFDTLKYTTMSNALRFERVLYFSVGFDSRGNPDGSTRPNIEGMGASPSTPTVLDIAAVQAIYGADPDTNAGNTVYRWAETDSSITSVYDAGGNDTFDLSANVRSSVVDLTPGAYSSISKWSLEDQLTFWEQKYANDPLIRQLAARDQQLGDKFFTWESNVGIAFSTTIENVIGGAAADVIKGNAVANALSGLAGDDHLQGLAGDDSLDGGAGADSVYGGAGDDTLRDLSGANYLRGDEGADGIYGGADFDDINGNMGDDTASGGAGTDWVVGGKDNDLMFGDEGNDIVYGNLGSDTCDGGDGDDIVRGGQEDDVVRGGAGADFVSGDRGADTMTGGSGADVFHTFGEAGLDRVTDFNAAEGDRVQLDPGTQYAVAQVGADTVITMSGGGQMLLVGVQVTSLAPGWLFGA